MPAQHGTQEHPWFDVRNRRFAGGAKGDGIADDTLAIQASINDCNAAGGGVVYFPPGTYLVSQAGSANGLAWALAVYGDNVTLRGAGPVATRIKTNSAAAMPLLFICGSAKPEGPTQWLKYAPWRFAGDTFAGGGAITPVCPFTAYTINAAARGAGSIVTAAAADAGNFAAGDFIYIRTGQLVANAGNWNAQPDSVISRVVSANPGTGVIVLDRALPKAFAQEYQSAIGQISSTTVDVVSCPLAVTKITSATISNIRVCDLTLENLVGTTELIFVRGAVSGYAEENVVTDSLGGAADYVEYRDGTFKRKTSTMRGTHRSDLWPITTATGVSDVTIEDLTAIATAKIAVLHVHEGSSRIKARNVRLFSVDNSIGGTYPVSVRARVYDFTLDDYIINGGGVSSAIFVGATESGGGRIGKGSARGSWARTIACQSPGWEITPPDDTRGGDVQYEPLVRATGRPLQRVAYAGWLSDDVQTVTLGEMPAQTWIAAVFVYVYETFDGSGTGQVKVGYDANTTAFGTLVDVKTGGLKTFAPGVTYGYMDVARTVKAYFVAGGSAPTVGKALVVFETYTVPTHVA